MTRELLLELLEQDRIWCLYAIGDLQPGYFEQCRWFVRGRSVGLLYEGCTPPVFFALGDPDELLPEVELPGEFYMQLRDEFVERIAETRVVRTRRRACRMALDRGRFAGAAEGRGVRLAEADVPALHRLYADGGASGEAPDFFFPDMVSRGCFFGAFEGGELIAVAGTHLVAPAYGIAAIGNVYTHQGYRGKGLAASLTSQVAATLLADGISTIGLNVYEANAAARRIYERLGFAAHCSYSEGVASTVSCDTSIEQP